MENGWFLPGEKWMETRWNMLKFKRDFVREYDIDPESSPHNRPASCKNWHGPWYSSYIYMVVPTIYIKPIHPSQSRIKHIHTQKKATSRKLTSSHSQCLSRFWMSSSGLGSTPWVSINPNLVQILKLMATQSPIPSKIGSRFRWSSSNRSVQFPDLPGQFLMSWRSTPDYSHDCF